MKKFLIFAACCVLVFLGAWLTLTLVLDEERLKRIAAEQVRAQTGRELTISGPLELSIVPRIALVAEDVTLSGPDGYRGPSLFEADRFEMSVRLLPLLTGEVETGEIRLADAEINVWTDPGGRSSLAGLGGAGGGPSEGPAPSISTEAIELRDVRIVVGGAGQGDPTVLMTERLFLDAFRFGEPVRFEYRGRVGDPAVLAEIRSSGTLTVPADGGPVMVRDFEVDGRVSDLPVQLSGTVEIQRAPRLRAALSDGRLELDGEPYALSVTWIDGTPARLTASLDGERLDADALLARLGGGETDTGSGEGEAPEQASPLAALAELDLDASLSLDTLVAGGLTLTEVEARAQSERGVLVVDPLRGRIEGGSVRATARIDATREPHAVTVRPVFELESLGSALAPWGLDRFVTGAGDLEMDLSGRGLTAAELLGSLNGGGQYRFQDGSVRGVDLSALVSGLSERNVAQAVQAATGGQTRFGSLNGALSVADGTLTLPDFRLEAQGFSAAGQVRIGLAQLGLDGQLRVAGSGLPSAIPVALGGSLTRPSLAPDLAGAVRQEAGRRVMDLLNRELEKRSSSEEEEEGDDGTGNGG